MTDAGIYIHIPYCLKKCAYCDFYSLPDFSGVDAYCEALIKDVKNSGGYTVSSVFFGGGTPSCIGAERLCKILDAVRSSFPLTEDCEITTEANPKTVNYEDFCKLSASGFNRISVGLQSFNGTELKILGRIHTAQDALNAVNDAKRAGITNINLDLMYGIPEQTPESFKKSVEFAVDSGASHISAYALKIEENTPFYRTKDKLNLPDDSAQFEMYSMLNETLAANGIFRYEISNFSKPGRECRHNLKYWRGVDYLGFGAAASSFTHGRRYTYSRSTDGYINSKELCEDMTLNDYDREFEFVMLRLRLAEGINKAEYKSIFKKSFDSIYGKTVSELKNHGLLTDNEQNTALTVDGVFVSNEIICRLTDNIPQ